MNSTNDPVEPDKIYPTQGRRTSDHLKEAAHHAYSTSAELFRAFGSASRQVRDGRGKYRDKSHNSRYGKSHEPSSFAGNVNSDSMPKDYSSSTGNKTTRQSRLTEEMRRQAQKAASPGGLLDKTEVRVNRVLGQIGHRFGSENSSPQPRTYKGKTSRGSVDRVVGIAQSGVSAGAQMARKYFR